MSAEVSSSPRNGGREGSPIVRNRTVPRTGDRDSKEKSRHLHVGFPCSTAVYFLSRFTNRPNSNRSYLFRPNERGFTPKFHPRTGIVHKRGEMPSRLSTRYERDSHRRHHGSDSDL